MRMWHRRQLVGRAEDRWVETNNTVQKTTKSKMILRRIKDSGCDPMEHKGMDVVLAQLVGSDGKNDHVVSIARVTNFDGSEPKDLPMMCIFDGSQEKALPVTVESLNECCSTEGHPTMFQRFGRTHLLERHKLGVLK